LGIIALGVAAAAAAGASPALAGGLGTSGDVSYYEGTTPIAAAGETPVNAECQNVDTRLVGVGADAATLSNSAEGSINTLRPTDSVSSDPDDRPDDITNAYVSNPGAANTAAAYAACMPGKTKYRQETFKIKPASAKSARVECPDGTGVTGGGAVVFGPADSGWLTASHPFDGRDRKRKPDDGWRVKAFNDDELDATQMTLTAICRPGKHVYCSAVGANVVPGQGSISSDLCGAEGPALSAGGRIYGQNPSGLHLSALRTADNTSQGDPDTVPDDHAIAEVHNLSAGDAKFDTYGIYEKP
jgi:hypothetical protein